MTPLSIPGSGSHSIAVEEIHVLIIISSSNMQLHADNYSYTVAVPSSYGHRDYHHVLRSNLRIHIGGTPLNVVSF